jgi:hypothetical protein
VVLAATDVSLLHRLVVLDASAQLFVLETMGSKPRAVVWAVLAGAATELAELEHLMTAVGSKIAFMPLAPFTRQSQAELDQRTMRNSISRASQRLASVSEGERITSSCRRAADRDRSAVIGRVSAVRQQLERLDDVVLGCHLAREPLPPRFSRDRAAIVRTLTLLHEQYCDVNGGVPDVWPF